MQQPFVVVGGGVAGTTCAETLAVLAPTREIVLLSASPALKGIASVVRITDNLDDFDVVERALSSLTTAHPNIRVRLCDVTSVNVAEKTVCGSDASVVPFDKLCVCTGARPSRVFDHPAVVTIRDVESVDDIKRRLGRARRVVVVGNGGLAMDFVHTVSFCDVVWAVKDLYIGNTYFDASASAFLLDAWHSTLGLSRSAAEGATDGRGDGGSGGSRGPRVEAAHVFGNAVGPNWMGALREVGVSRAAVNSGGHVHIEFGVELRALRDPPEGSDWAVVVELTNGACVECDFVLSATGVVPAVDVFGDGFERGPDGGVVVNNHMQTSASPDVYAAGDVASVTWPESPLWFQMRLWHQARAMGAYAAHCMAGEVDELVSGMSFELFEHVTRFMGFKVVLLGKFNGQGLAPAEERAIRTRVVTSDGLTGGAEDTSGGVASGYGVEMLVRVTPGVEYIKLVLNGGRVEGALLIGRTDLEETCENLILNRTDVSALAVDLLDPSIDIEDYFD